MLKNFSLPSLPGIVAGLPSTENLQAKFVYNFFMPDERVNEISRISSTDGATDNASYAARIGKIPRFIQLDFNQTFGQSRRLDISRIIREGTKIIFEDSPFNMSLSAISIADTVADARAYEIASASFNLPGSTQANSRGFAEGSLYETRGASILGETKSFIFNSLRNIQPAGYRYANSDVKENIQDQFLRNIKGFSSSVTFNNNFIDDITARILQNENSIFADEFAAARQKTSNIQEVSRRTSSPLEISANAYNYTVPFYDYEILDERPTLELINRKNVYHVGYIIEKFGQSIDGSVKIFDTFYLNANQQSLIDPAVRYGGLYSYTVRSLYNFDVYITTETPDGRPSGFARAQALFATTGKNIDVFCEETYPPDPPEDVYFKLMPMGDLFIGWQFPFNAQRDIKRFQIFRRKKLEDPFELLREIDFDDSLIKSPNLEQAPSTLVDQVRFPTTFFIDEEFDVNSKFIYAVASIDAHGYTSNFSAQFEVSVNLFTEELRIKNVVRKGCPKPYPNLFLTSDFFSDLLKDSGHTKMTVFLNPDYTDLKDAAGNSLGVMSFNNRQPTYKLHILETNLAQDQIVDITLSNEKVPIGIPISEAKVYTQVV